MSEIKINSTGELKLFDSDNSNFVSIKSPATVSSNQTFILPDADGSANNALKTDGSGNLGFVDVTTLVTEGIQWQSSIKTSTFTAVSGEGYFCNTSGGAFTATLPASPSAGAIVALKDYAPSFATNNLTVGRNSSNIQGAGNDSVLQTNRASVVLVYVDSTKGWLYVQESNVQGLSPYVSATGGTITTSGDFKIHTFLGDGTFTVTNAGTSSGSTTVDYLIVAGGGGGGSHVGGGGGAGGMRFSFPNPATGGTSVSAQAYPISVGSGGAKGTGSGVAGSKGSDSTWNSITSAGGGGGGTASGGTASGGAAPGGGGPGGSGGGGGHGNPGSPAGPLSGSGGSGNTPPVSPSQGNPGGIGRHTGNVMGGGGGGHGAAGENGSPTAPGTSDGGDGTQLNIDGNNYYWAGGGGGGGIGAAPLGTTGTGGLGGGGGGAAENATGGPGGGTALNSGVAGGSGSGSAGGAGGENTGGGGGSGGHPNPSSGGGAGGKGIVIIRYKYQN